MSYVYLFLPILTYAILVLLIKKISKLTFDRNAIVFGMAVIGYLAASYFAGLFLFAGLQIVATILIGLLMIFFLGGKAGGETMFSFLAVIGLTPFLTNFIPTIAMLIIFIGYMFYEIRKQKDSVLLSILSAASATGLGTALPDYSVYPDKKDMKKVAGKTISLLPFIVIFMGGTVLYYLFQLMTLEN